MLINFKSYDVSFQRKHIKPPGAKSTYNPDRIVTLYEAFNVEKIQDMSYHSVLPETLKSTPNSDFEEKLKKILDIKSLSMAEARIGSLSRYLKEDMIGFVVPEYEIGGEKKGGYQWFEKGAEYLLKGCKQNVSEKDFPSMAKNLYGLLALHDNYWKSKEFVNYLSTLKQTPAIKATKQAVQELQKNGKDISFKAYFSPLKGIDKLLNDGCAYSAVQLESNLKGVDKLLKKGNKSSEIRLNFPKIPRDKQASLDHIMPKSWGGPCEDYNYVLCSSETNSARGNIGLLDFLKGGFDEQLAMYNPVLYNKLRLLI
ncbi:MAG: hypothetical protein WC197_06270 [Candidatus Gastranaerophilaceae bacterium]